MKLPWNQAWDAASAGSAVITASGDAWRPRRTDHLRFGQSFLTNECSLVSPTHVLLERISHSELGAEYGSDVVWMPPHASPAAMHAASATAWLP